MSVLLLSSNLNAYKKNAKMKKNTPHSHLSLSSLSHPHELVATSNRTSIVAARSKHDTLDATLHTDLRLHSLDSMCCDASYIDVMCCHNILDSIYSLKGP